MKYPDMRSYIRQLQQSRGLSLQDLSRMLGYSSATSLTRLMQDNATQSSLQQFSERLRACDDLKLTRAECNQLDDLIELNDIGEDYETMVALRRLLRGEPTVTAPLLLYDKQGNSCSFLAHFASRSVRRMLLLNCEQVGMFNDLALLMEQGSFTLEHWLYCGTSSLHTVNSLRCAMPLIYSPQYRSYTYQLRFEPSASARGLMVSDLMLYEYAGPDGQLRNEMIIFTAASRGEILPVSVTMEEMRRFLPPREALQPVRQQIVCGNLIEYNDFCAELERDRMVCTIKSDPCIAQIPLAVLRASLLDAAPQEVLDVLPALESSFARRQQNMREKSAPQYYIYRRGAMRRFAQTGVLSDHLWCCRPFTVAERVQILRGLLEELTSRDNVHLCFLKEDEALRYDEIVFFEDRGLSIIQPQSPYEDGTAIHEVLITQPELLKVFKRFIIESTLRYRVDTPQSAAAFLEQLIAECESRL